MLADWAPFYFSKKMAHDAEKDQPRDEEGKFTSGGGSGRKGSWQKKPPRTMHGTTLFKARGMSLVHTRSPKQLRAAARALMTGNERDRARAAEFSAKASRMEKKELDMPEGRKR